MLIYTRNRLSTRFQSSAGKIKGWHCCGHGIIPVSNTFRPRKWAIETKALAWNTQGASNHTNAFKRCWSAFPLLVPLSDKVFLWSKIFTGSECRGNVWEAEEGHGCCCGTCRFPLLSFLCCCALRKLFWTFFSMVPVLGWSGLWWPLAWASWSLERRQWEWLLVADSFDVFCFFPFVSRFQTLLCVLCALVAKL